MEDHSDAATNGASGFIYGVNEYHQQQPPSMHKTFSCAQDTSSCAAVSPFLDFRNQNNNIMLSQSSTASSVTFDSSVKMELESPQQHRSGSIFDSLCFISDANNNDNSSSVSMESPMGNFCSLEPVKKKSRKEGVFFGGATSEVAPERGMVVDASLQPQEKASEKSYCCHVCGNAAADIPVIANLKCTTTADSISGQSNITMKTTGRAPKSHSLLNYFAKGKVSEKKATFKSKSLSPIQENNTIRCQYCDKATCSSCTRQCERCCRDFCTFCSRVDYGGVVEKIMCFECGYGKMERYENCFQSSDADMMDS
jgi:hypothetical protein